MGHQCVGLKKGASFNTRHFYKIKDIKELLVH